MAPAAAILLTGGASRRMGRDKATLPADGRIPTDGREAATLATRTAALARAVAPLAVEVGPGHSGLPVVADGWPGAGPLAAMATGAAWLAARGWSGPAVVLAVDLPALHGDLLRWLIDHPATGSVIPLDRAGRAQPLCARYHHDDLLLATALATDGQRALAALLDVSADLTLVAAGEWEPIAGPDALADADTPGDLARALRRGREASERGQQGRRSRLRARPPGPVTDVRAVVYRGDHHVAVPERVATEEPLEIRVAGPGQAPRAAVVTMRTPGHDFELAAGFLVTEGLVGPGEVAGVAYCDATEVEQPFNTVTVHLRRPWDPDATRRDFVATAACGVCGKTSIDAVELACPPVPPSRPVPGSVVVELPERLRQAQRTFRATGGLHAAGLFDSGGQLLCAREDVGRHNAVDKVVGQGVLATHQPGAGRVLMVSGRVSFEIVQKAAMAGFGVLAAVSAPSSLAVSAAERLGVTVAGFVRDGRCNVYSRPEGIDLER